MKIVFVSYEIQEQYNRGVRNNEEAELLGFLHKKGLDITPVIWTDHHIDWTSFDLVVLKSPWDYHLRTQEFLAWLELLRKLNIRLLNPVDIVQWNSHRFYLKDISDKGFAVIPSTYPPQSSSVDDSLLTHFYSDELVVKPCAVHHIKKQKNLELCLSYTNDN